MKTYKITASSITYYTLDIEAESLEQAEEIAHDIDGGDFQEVPFSGDWDIYSVEEVQSWFMQPLL